PHSMRGSVANSTITTGSGYITLLHARWRTSFEPQRTGTPVTPVDIVTTACDPRFDQRRSNIRRFQLRDNAASAGISLLPERATQPRTADNYGAQASSATTCAPPYLPCERAQIGERRARL